MGLNNKQFVENEEDLGQSQTSSVHAEAIHGNHVQMVAPRQLFVQNQQEGSSSFAAQMQQAVEPEQPSPILQINLKMGDEIEVIDLYKGDNYEQIIHNLATKYPGLEQKDQYALFE